ncbi:MAG TPA: nuclear transport factor 2 family protein [Planctomycetota bacterium]|nr:nuclear transport factor 2 family protein [Planctomycetota bacterium]
MSIENALASVPVRDLSSAVPWYASLFGRPPDSGQESETVEWKFEKGGWLQVYQNAERAGSGSLSLVVSSLAEQVSTLAKWGLDAGRPMISEKLKVVMIKDPDDNSIAFAETIGATSETRIPDVIHAYFSAYERKDRVALEGLLADDFTFSSPHDPHLDRPAYFERCWPNSEDVNALEIQSLAEGPDEAFVLYECTPMAGAAFSNAEYFCLEGGKISKVRVFYGSLPEDS